MQRCSSCRRPGIADSPLTSVAGVVMSSFAQSARTNNQQHSLYPHSRLPMNRFVRFVVRLSLLLIAAAVLAYLIRNPEKQDLDAKARESASGRFVTLSDGVTHYDIAGPDTGRAVILVHGSSVPYYIWDSTSVALSDAGYRVIRYDRFGIGYSDRPDATYDSTMFTRQIDELADSLKLTKFDLMGLSYGGFVTAHYAIAHRDRVRTLTLVDPVAESGAVPAFFQWPVVGTMIFNTIALPGRADGQPGDFLHPEKFPGWADRYRPQMTYRGLGRSMLRTAVATSRVNFEDLYKRAGATGVPVMLIWGKQDPVVAIAHAEMVRRAIPSLVYLPVDSAGHLPAMEQSTLVHAKMREFLEAHGDTPLVQPSGAGENGNAQPDRREHQ
jgi:pimeloyl-ACP methyl ester carboxylesterase